MDAERIAAVLLIAGSFVFFVGAAIGVPRVFMEPNAETRFRMIEERLGAWRLAQPLYAIGPLIAGVGVAVLATAATARSGRILFVFSATTLLIGVLAWSRDVTLRRNRVREFAFGTLPGWPFAAYVLLTIAGLGLLGAGLVTAGAHGWIGWVTIAADVLFLVAYLGFRDIPPFVFYILLSLVGVGLL